ncbi:MAG: hypothetical protein JEZ11_25415 [Desulfobacterales bacterium]|nr:hypothetical protein [Desulfobacterales bacterium]
MSLIERLNTAGEIAVWGIGYLGYTTLLRCHRFGLATHVWAPEEQHLEALRQGLYPGRELQIAWSEVGSVPPAALEQITFADSPERLLAKNLPVHVIALPNHGATSDNGDRVWETIAGHFRRHAPRDRKTLVLLASAPVPGDTQAFVRALADLGPHLRVVTAFRPDWVVEDYLYRSRPQALGGDSDDLVRAQAFLTRIGMETFAIGSFHDAEVYQVLMSSFQCLVSGFVSQFAFAYPENPANRITAAVLANCDLSRVRPTIGVGGKQMMTGLEFLFRGSPYNDLLSILKEAQAFNLSSILSYADFLARRGVGRVGILGITPQPDNRDLAFSPSLLLAEALMGRGLEVFVHDPHFTFETIRQLLPGVRHLDVAVMGSSSPLGSGDAVILMTPHRFYLKFTQRDIDEKIAGRAGLVIDNTGAWRHLTFSQGTRYHFVGDGTLNINR